MSPIEKKVESVEVINKTTNQIVPSQLTKTNDNPSQWTCSFIQPAGVVSIRPKMRAIFYSVIIEECENCSVVLVESNDEVDIQLASVAAAEDSSADEQASGEPFTPEDSSANEHDPADKTSAEEEAIVSDSSYEAEAATKEASDEAQGDATNFNNPQHSADNEEHADEATDVEETKTHEAIGTTQDAVYDAGEFEDELEDIEPTVITQAECDKKNKAYWQHRNAFIAGQISKEEFDGVEKKHMEFLDAISSGLIKVQES